MVFDKVEFIYSKDILPLKIIYSEIRKPTLIEFLVLSIILEHPNKQNSLQEILQEDFKIINTELFERALKDLITYKIVDLNKSKAGWSTLGMDIEIEKLQIEKNIINSFLKKDFIISQSNKGYDIKWAFDQINNSCELINEVYWDKRVNDVKYSFKYEKDYENENFWNSKIIMEKLNDFIKNNVEIFGTNFVFESLKINNEFDIENIKIAKPLLVKSACAIELKVKIIKNKFEVQTDDIDLKTFLNQNTTLQKDIVESVIIQYNKKILDTLVPKRDFISNEDFEKEEINIGSINIKTSQNLLLINNQDIKSFDKLLNIKHLLSSAKTIIFYNTKANNKTIETKNGRIISYVESTNDEILNKNSLIYIDSENNLTGFAITNYEIDFLKIKTPVAYKFKYKNKINLKQVFENNLERVLESYKEELLTDEIDKSTITFLFLKRLGLEQKLNDILFDYLKKDIDQGKKFKSLISIFSKENNKEAINFLENILKNVFIELSKKRNSQNIIDLLERYNFENKNIFIELIININLDDELDNILRINTLLENKNLDGWKINIRNCLTSLFKYAKNKNIPSLLDENNFTSVIYKQHANIINSIGKITKYLYQENFDKVKDSYFSLLNKILDLIKSFSYINNFKDYLIAVSECLTPFYKAYYDYKIKEIQYMDKESNEYILETKSANFINHIEEQLDLIISNEAITFPIEIKIEWAKHINKKINEVENILNNDSAILYLALNIVFGKKEVYSKESLINFQNRIRGI
ncbi:hypothetical protein SGLAD_v1c01750 [Spiroplasma gladiatoris]|uniref:Uncharacterized protein n=1 Tax=Spiroplasma gladiatoris TaxID=2143 RepID=A0A4P7AG97_9MOLU|nr:hypothetical protein [Spiroplasma gladiatoris]QBQ07374.1 hypothetical protein SGLAD_v1c01750 [Spiroplasma gladiatoris]